MAVRVKDRPNIGIDLLYSMLDFVECVCWWEAKFKYKPIYLVNYEGDGDGLLQCISDNIFCIDHHLQKLI